MKRTIKYTFLLSAMLILWNTYILKPIKIVAMFIHEIGHFIMAFIFGNRFNTFNITLNEMGHASIVTKEWFPSFLIANGGYILSLLFAIFLLSMKNINRKKRAVGIVAVFILTSLIYIEKIPASFLYIMIFSVIIMIAYILNNDKIFEWLNDIIGISSVAYCIHETLIGDIIPKVALKIDSLKGLTPNGNFITDAQTLHKITGIPTVIWGIIWLVISILALMVCMRESNTRKRYLK